VYIIYTVYICSTKANTMTIRNSYCYVSNIYFGIQMQGIEEGAQVNIMDIEARCVMSGRIDKKGNFSYSSKDQRVYYFADQLEKKVTTACKKVLSFEKRICGI
jgi:hypothetical protein